MVSYFGFVFFFLIENIYNYTKVERKKSNRSFKRRRSILKYRNRTGLTDQEKMEHHDEHTQRGNGFVYLLTSKAIEHTQPGNTGSDKKC